MIVDESWLSKYCPTPNIEKLLGIGLCEHTEILATLEELGLLVEANWLIFQLGLQRVPLDPPRVIGDDVSRKSIYHYGDITVSATECFAEDVCLGGTLHLEGQCFNVGKLVAVGDIVDYGAPSHAWRKLNAGTVIARGVSVDSVKLSIDTSLTCDSLSCKGLEGNAAVSVSFHARVDGDIRCRSFQANSLVSMGHIVSSGDITILVGDILTSGTIMALGPIVVEGAIIAAGKVVAGGDITASDLMGNFIVKQVIEKPGVTIVTDGSENTHDEV